MKEIGELIDTRLTALLGMDILGRLDFRINLEEAKFTVTEGTMDFGGAAIPTESFQGVPVIRAGFEHGEEKCFFDTGAKLSYLHSSLAGNYPVVGKDSDFFPGFGKFKTEVRGTCEDRRPEVRHPVRHPPQVVGGGTPLRRSQGNHRFRSLREERGRDFRQAEHGLPGGV